MSYLRPWTPENVARYLPVEALTKDPEVFQRTHVPIDRIRVDARSGNLACTAEAVGGRQVVFTSESDLLAFVRDSRPQEPNRISLIVGETGSGKSELCQSIAYALAESPSHVPILIQRSRTKLRDIVGAIEDKLGQVRSAPRELDEVPPELFSATIRVALLEYIYSQAGRRAFGANVDALGTIINLPLFEDGLRSVYTRYRDEIARPGGVRVPDLLPLETFKQLTGAAYQATRVALRRDLNDDRSAVEVVYERLEPQVRSALARFLQVEDLMNKVALLSARFKERERRPVLLIEDITTFGFLQSDLLDYLFDLSSGNYEAMLGITTDFAAARFDQLAHLGPQQTVRSRIALRLVLTDDNRRTLFAENHYLTLARRHLQGIVDVPQPEPLWWNCFDRCYPVSPITIQRIWAGLKEDGLPKRTPRLLLRTLRAVLESAFIPSETLNQQLGQQLTAPPVDVVLPDKAAAEVQGLAMWYGLPTRDGVFLPIELFDAFAVSVSGLQMRDNWIVVPLAPGLRSRYADVLSPLHTGAPSAVPEVEASSEVVSTVPLPPPLVPTVEEPLTAVEETRSALIAWLRTGAEFPHRELLARGILTGLDHFGLDPFELRPEGAIAAEGRPIVLQAPGRAESRVAFEGLSSDRDIPRVLIARRESDRPVLEWLLVLADRTSRDERDFWDDPNVPLVELYEYLAQRTEATHERALQDLKDEAFGGLQIEQLAALAKVLLLAGSGNSARSTHELSARMVESDLPVSAPATVFASAWGRLAANADVLQQLFVASFYLQGSFLNHDLAEACLNELRAETDFMGALGQLQRARPQRLRTIYGVRSARPEALGEAVEALQGFVTALRMWLQQAPRTALRQVAASYVASLPTVEELPRIAELASDFLAYQESVRFVRPEWRAAVTALGTLNAREQLEVVRQEVVAIQLILASTHPLDVLAAQRRIDDLNRMPIIAALVEAQNLAAQLKRDRTLDTPAGAVDGFARLEALMSELVRVSSGGAQLHEQVIV